MRRPCEEKRCGARSSDYICLYSCVLLSSDLQLSAERFWLSLQFDLWLRASAPAGICDWRVTISPCHGHWGCVAVREQFLAQSPSRCCSGAGAAAWSVGSIAERRPGGGSTAREVRQEAFCAAPLGQVENAPPTVRAGAAALVGKGSCASVLRHIQLQSGWAAGGSSSAT